MILPIFRSTRLYNAACNFTALLVGRSRDRFPVVSLGIFPMVSPTDPCALRSTQPLKVSTRDFSWGKGGRCIWLTTYHPCSAETSRKSGALTYPEPLGPPRPVAGDLYLYHKLHYTVWCSWWWAKSLPETCRAKLKLLINCHCCFQLDFFFKVCSLI